MTSKESMLNALSGQRPDMPLKAHLSSPTGPPSLLAHPPKTLMPICRKRAFMPEEPAGNVTGAGEGTERDNQHRWTDKPRERHGVSCLNGCL